MFAGIELDEVPDGELGPTPPTGELALPLHDVPLLTDVRATLGPNQPVVSVDDPASIGGIQNVANHRGITRDCFDPVHGVGECELVVLECAEQRDAQFHRIPVHSRRKGWRPQRVCPAGDSNA